MTYHQPVLLKESIEGLNIKPDGVYVDATFGGGGHTKEILRILAGGKLIAFDQDEDAEVNLPQDERIIFVKHNFRFLKNFLRYYDFNAIDGLIADLGVSSHHFDTPRRGFSFRHNAKLDMRMNTQSAFSAKELINTYSVDELSRVFREYGELKNARKLALTIHQKRQSAQITETSDLINSISGCIPRQGENQYLAKVFQAIRIEVNKEIDHLKSLLVQATALLNKKGRLVIISYHSLEDRLVKNYFRYGNFEGKPVKDIYGNIQRSLDPVNRKVIIPSSDEIKINNRARSARLRIAEKT